jgi:quinol-cytochrome oxidoreductase complex cytochrome b subunit
MFAAIILLFFIPALTAAASKQIATLAPFDTVHRIAIWIFFGIFLILMFLGTRAAAAPFVHASKAFTAFYFMYFILAVPSMTLLASRLFILQPTKVIV